MTKKEALEAAARGEGCLGHAAEDEPVFVLRASDPLAAFAIRHWAAVARISALHNDKREDAEAVAVAVEEWRKANGRMR